MPGRSRRRLDRLRYAVGYWWLEQTDRWSQLGRRTVSLPGRFARATAHLRIRAGDALASPRRRPGVERARASTSRGVGSRRTRTR